ncbi:MAG TPA: hypothetical protein ENK40_00250 [Gammaproteobacteria bacterium]|nr:hypothetical protein [Gammaproteobacteria bacterium]
MEKKDNMPLWVFLAFSSIETRRGALILIGVCAAFSVLMIPLEWYPWIEWIDWSWTAMMVAVTLWYWLALKWCDKHGIW